jgi:hypothetical protein
MMQKRMLLPVAVLILAACGGGDGEGAPDEGLLTDTTSATSIPEAPPAPAGTVDTAGMGVNPPTAGGQVVDTAAVPGPVDTAQGTATAP